MEDYQQEVLGKYYGMTAERLVVERGIPSNTLNLGSVFLIVYQTQEKQYIPKSYTADTNYWINNSSTTTIREHGGCSIDLWCKTTFMLRNGRVYNVHAEGNNCFSKRFVWK